MEKKICGTCKENDCGLCDFRGVWVEEEDYCDKWKDSRNWKEVLLESFLKQY